MRVTTDPVEETRSDRRFQYYVYKSYSSIVMLLLTVNTG